METPTLMLKKQDPAVQKHRASIMVGTLVLLFFLVTVFIFIQTSQTGIWQWYVLGGGLLLGSLICFLGLWFIQRERVHLGLGLALGISLLNALSISYLFAGVGLGLGIAVSMLFLILINQGLSPKQMQGWAIAIFGAAVITILLDLFGSPNRPSPAAFQIILNGGVSLTVLLFIGITFWFFDKYDLSTKLVLSFLSVILPVFGVLGFLTNRTIIASLGQAAGQDLNNQIRSQTLLIGATLDSQIDLLQSLSSSQTQQNWVIEQNQSYEGLTEPAQIPALLAERDQLWRTASAETEAFIATLDNQATADLLRFQTLFPEHLELFLTDQYGGVIAATRRSRAYYQADEPWWQAAYNQGQGRLYIGQPELDENSQAVVLPLAIPLLDEQKQVIGILHSAYRFAAILDILAQQNQTLPVGTNLAVLFPDDQLYNLETGQYEPLSAAEAALLKDGGEAVYRQMSFRGQERLLSWAAFDDALAPSVLTALNWQFIIFQDPQIGLALGQKQSRNMILLALGGATLVILVAFFVSGRISRSLNGVALAVQQIISGDLNAQAPVDTADEVGLLAQNFNTMTACLRDLIDNLEERVAQRTLTLLWFDALFICLIDNLEEWRAQRTQQLETLVEIGDDISQTFELVALMQTVISLTKETFDYYHVHIYLLDKAEETLLLAEGYGLVGTAMKETGHQISLNQPQSLVARAACSRQVVQVDNVRETPDWLPNDLLPNTNAEMAVPIISAGRVMGVLAVQSEQVAGLDDSDATLLQLLANQIAVALRNAQLFAQNEEARRQAEVAQKSAEIANRAKSDFLSGMNHELRTPLNGILGYSQILRRSRTMAESDRKGVAIIQSSGEHLLTLINDLLDLAKIEAGKMDLLPNTLHLPTFLENMANIIHSQAKEKNLNFLLECQQSLPPGIEADRTRLQQVLFNLLDNAIKFTDEGQVTLKVSLLNTISGSNIDPRQVISLRFEIQDTGLGIKPEQLQTIFKPYEQVDKGQRPGTGLGLAITRQLVNLMGGDLQVDSRPGQGSRFWFEVSFPKVESLRLETEADQTLINGYEGERRKVLIVDDRPENQWMLQSMLEPLGFALQTAENGQEAVQQTQRFEPDLILMDLLMPVLDGIEAIRIIRAATDLAQPKIVVVSAEAFQEERQRAQAVGCDDYLVKPIEKQKLLTTIGQQLELSWVRAAASKTELSPANGDEVSPGALPPITFGVIPPVETLETLYELVQLGQATKIQVMMQTLQEQDEQYQPFAQRIITLAASFDEDKMMSLIEEHLP